MIVPGAGSEALLGGQLGAWRSALLALSLTGCGDGLLFQPIQYGADPIGALTPDTNGGRTLTELRPDAQPVGRYVQPFRKLFSADQAITIKNEGLRILARTSLYGGKSRHRRTHL